MANQPDWSAELHDAMDLLEKGHPKNCLAALHAMLQDYGKDDFCRAIVFDGMGRALFADQQPDLGMEAFAESLSILRKLFSEQKVPPDFMLGALINQAHAQMVSGKPDEAIKIGKEALALAEKTWGVESPQAAQALFHLSAPYYETKDYDMAENLLLRAKNIWDLKPAGNLEQIATCLNNIGRIYEERGKADHGAAYHRRAMEIRRTLPNKEDLAFSLGNYGVALGTVGKLQDACDALRESVVVYNAIGKADIPEAKAFEANLELFEKALHNSKKGE